MTLFNHSTLKEFKIMSYPNVARQSVNLQDRLYRLLVIKNNFKQLASNSITTVEELRHRATNYDSIRRPEILNRFVDSLSDYKYSLEYLQTFIKDITNNTIANKLLELNRLREAQFQSKLSEKSSECDAIKTEMAHLDLLIKELKEEQVTIKLKLQQYEAEIEALKAQVTTQADSIKTLNAENAEQYELIVQQDSKIQHLTVENQSLRVDVNKLVNALQETNLEWRQEMARAAKEQEAALARAAKEREEAIAQVNLEWRAELAKSNEKWLAKLDKTNEEWLVKYNEQRKFFEAEIAEVRGRLDNLEAQMRAMTTDTQALKAKVEELSLPVSDETKQEITRDLANLVALSYSTVSNLHLVDPVYEQRQHWFKMLKEVFKLTKQLPRYGFNVRQHLDFMRLMFKANPC